MVPAATLMDRPLRTCGLEWGGGGLLGCGRKGQGGVCADDGGVRAAGAGGKDGGVIEASLMGKVVRTWMREVGQTLDVSSQL